MFGKGQMSQDSERVKKLVAFKEKLAKRVETLETELEDLKTLLETVNSMLLEKGFKHAEIPKEPPKTSTSQREEVMIEPEPLLESPTGHEDVVPLKTAAGELLAILHVTENSLRVLPAEDKNFNANTQPFNHFLVERVLVKMQERDTELIRTGQQSPERIFSYNIVREGDVIREIMIRNVDPDRLRELKSSIRWTLEKMYEKMKTQV
jgi:hypothetical protein